jgi:hypothetical protein
MKKECHSICFCSLCFSQPDIVQAYLKTYGNAPFINIPFSVMGSVSGLLEEDQRNVILLKEMIEKNENLESVSIGDARVATKLAPSVRNLRGIEMGAIWSMYKLNTESLRELLKNNLYTLRQFHINSKIPPTGLLDLFKRCRHLSSIRFAGVSYANLESRLVLRQHQIKDASVTWFCIKKYCKSHPLSILNETTFRNVAEYLWDIWPFEEMGPLISPLKRSRSVKVALTEADM